MKKGLAMSLLVAISLGIGVLGTNIYYSNLLKTQIKQLSTTNKEKEKLEDTAEDKEEATTNKDTNLDKETQDITENKNVKGTNKSNDTNKTKQTTKSENNLYEDKPTPNILAECPGCGNYINIANTRYGYCYNCWLKYGMPTPSEDYEYEEPVGDYWQIDPNNPDSPYYNGGEY